MFLSGCDADGDGKITVYDILVSVFSTLAEADCEVGPNQDEEGTQTARILVSDSRAVLLFVKHHIFVGGEPGPGGTWDPDVAVYTKSKSSWCRNKTLITRANARRLPGMANVNSVFDLNHTNIRFLSVGSPEILYEPKALPTTCNLFGPEGDTAAITREIIRNDPGYIHVFWGWGNDQAIAATGEAFRIVICSHEFISSDLAHEFVHALGVERHSSTSGNLMHEDFAERGSTLDESQIRLMWDFINMRGQQLVFLSCDAAGQP